MELKQMNSRLFCAGCALVLGGFAVGAIFIYLSIAYQSTYTYSEFLVTLIFLVPGAIMICGAILPYRLRASRLKQGGDCYEAEITDVHYVYGSDSSYVVECVYTNRDGKRYIVKAKKLCPTNGMPAYNAKDSFTAKVWVNPDNPRDYYVGVMFDSRKSGDKGKFDNDYR